MKSEAKWKYFRNWGKNKNGDQRDSRLRGNDPDEIAEAASHGASKNEIAAACGLAMTRRRAGDS
jgi:hypothetical protein